MKVALINSPVARRSPHSRLAPPLGLAYIASVLRMEGHEVSAVDFNVSGLNLKRVDLLLEWEKPEVVGLSAYTETYPNALAIARRVKELAPQTRIVMGGPHPSLLPEQVVADEAVDFVAVGEGEETMLELVQRIASQVRDFSDVRGLAYKTGQGPRVNERRKLLHPDSLPYPARELFPLEFYQDKWNVLTARGGCPFRCPFCSASAIWDGRRRARMPRHVAGEVQFLNSRYGAEYVFFSDDIFTLNRKWVRELLRELEGIGCPVEWGCATRVDMVDRGLLAEMAQAGCRSIQFGVESGSQRILDSVKGINKRQVLRAVEGAREAGIEVAASFMVPFPDDTEETIRETGDFMRQLFAAGSKILLSYTSPYPGTDFYQHASELGLKILTDRWEEFDAKHNILETRHLSWERIEELVAGVVRDTGLRKAAG